MDKLGEHVREFLFVARDHGDNTFERTLDLFLADVSPADSLPKRFSHRKKPEFRLAVQLGLIVNIREHDIIWFLDYLWLYLARISRTREFIQEVFQ
jgi:hypothetical protein